MSWWNERPDLEEGVAFAWWVEALLDEFFGLHPCRPDCRFCALWAPAGGTDPP